MALGHFLSYRGDSRLTALLLPSCAGTPILNSLLSFDWRCRRFEVVNPATIHGIRERLNIFRYEVGRGYCPITCGKVFIVGEGLMVYPYKLRDVVNGRWMDFESHRWKVSLGSAKVGNAD